MTGRQKRRSWRRCPHTCTVGIYGDAVNRAMGLRLQCIDCGRLLDGPVSLATHRNCTSFPTCHRDHTGDAAS